MSDGTLESYQNVARLTQLVKASPTSVTVGGEIIAYSFTGSIAPANISNIPVAAFRTEGWGKVSPEYVTAGAINTNLRSDQTWGKVNPPRILPGTNNTVVGDSDWRQVDPIRFEPGSANTVLSDTWQILPIAKIAPQTNSRAMTIGGVTTWVPVVPQGINANQYRVNVSPSAAFVKFNPPPSANFINGIYTVPFDGVYLLNIYSYDNIDNPGNYVSSTQYVLTKTSSPTNGPFTFPPMYSSSGRFVAGVSSPQYGACSRLLVLNSGDQYEIRYYIPSRGLIFEVGFKATLTPLAKI